MTRKYVRKPKIQPTTSPVPEKTTQEPLRTILTRSPIPEPPLYTKSLWGGRIENFQCTKCKVFLKPEETMILHVVKHFPENEQDKVLDKLIKELAG